MPLGLTLYNYGKKLKRPILMVVTIKRSLLIFFHSCMSSFKWSWGEGCLFFFLNPVSTAFISNSSHKTRQNSMTEWRKIAHGIYNQLQENTSVLLNHINAHACQDLRPHPGTTDKHSKKPRTQPESPTRCLDNLTAWHSWSFLQKCFFGPCLRSGRMRCLHLVYSNVWKVILDW